MGGVDKLDQMLEPYLVERKQCVKWTRKLFKRLLNISIQNARILLNKATNSSIPSLAFTLALIILIIIFDKHCSNVHIKTPETAPQHPRVSRAQLPEGRLTERHFIQRIPITEEMRQSAFGAFGALQPVVELTELMNVNNATWRSF